MAAAPKIKIPAHKAAFLEACIANDVLKFGTFTLKSKRVSPYFFNAGLFHRADLLRSISTAYAETLDAYVSSAPLGGYEAPLEFDVLFGPAYKGIPLATATVGKLAEINGSRYGGLSYSFNRKEAKDHGEGGIIVGAPLKGKRVIIVDDVITAGTAISEAIGIIASEGGRLVGIIVAMDRMEKAPSATDDDGLPKQSAIGELRNRYKIPILAVLTLDDIVEGLKAMGTEDDLRRLEAYRAKYKASE